MGEGTSNDIVAPSCPSSICCTDIRMSVASRPKEIPGTYVAKFDFGTDTLKLESDGTYIQEIKVKGRSDVLRASGTWRYDQGKSRINLVDVFAIQNRYSDEWDEGQ